MFEGVGSIRGRVTVKCHARRVAILFLVGHYRLSERQHDNRFKAISDGCEKLSRNWTRIFRSSGFRRALFAATHRQIERWLFHSSHRLSLTPSLSLSLVFVSKYLLQRRVARETIAWGGTRTGFLKFEFPRVEEFAGKDWSLTGNLLA